MAVAVLLCLGAANADETPLKGGRVVPKNVTLGDKDKPVTQLSSNTTGVGGSCVPTSTDFFGPGSGCLDTEACCPTTNTCYDKSGGCAAFAKRCPPPECSGVTFAPAPECPADVTKLFKKVGAKCEASSDMVCFRNETVLALKCSATSAAGAPAAPRLAAMLVAGLSVLAAILLH